MTDDMSGANRNAAAEPSNAPKTMALGDKPERRGSCAPPTRESDETASVGVEEIGDMMKRHWEPQWLNESLPGTLSNAAEKDSPLERIG